MSKVRIWFSANWTGAEAAQDFTLDEFLKTIGCTRDEWDKLSDSEKENEINEFAILWSQKYYETGGMIIED